MFFQVKETIPEVAPDIVFYLGNFPVTNSFLLTIFILALFLVLGLIIRRHIKVKNPSRGQTLAEMAYEGMLDLTSQITGDKKIAEKVFPLIGTLFVFIAVANLISIIPGLTSINYQGTSIFRTPTTDFNTTFGLALAMMLLVNLISLRRLGVFSYVGRFLQFKQVYRGFRQGIGSGLMALVNFGIGLLDIISEFAKVISLSLRLFGNIYAGEVLLVVMFAAIAYVIPTIWLSLSLVFGLIQAVVFGALVTIYYTQAVTATE